MILTMRLLFFGVSIEQRKFHRSRRSKEVVYKFIPDFTILCCLLLYYKALTSLFLPDTLFPSTQVVTSVTGASRSLNCISFKTA